MLRATDSHLRLDELVNEISSYFLLFETSNSDRMINICSKRLSSSRTVLGNSSPRKDEYNQAPVAHPGHPIAQVSRGSPEGKSQGMASQTGPHYYQ